MKFPILATAVVLSLAATPIFAEDAATTLTNPKDKVSYAIGMSIGENFKIQSIDVNPAMVAKGIEDGVSGTKPLMDKKQIEDTMVQFQKDLMSKREKQFKELSAKNMEEGQKYLTDNSKKEGVKTTESGLQYVVVTDGSGEKPTKDDLVTVEYEGKLINGTVFDSSYKRGKPVTFQVSQVIPGWVEMLQLMNKGETVEVVIPAKLAYGEHGIGDSVGPNQTLLFKIHLLDIKKGSDASKGTPQATPTASDTEQQSKE